MTTVKAGERARAFAHQRTRARPDGNPLWAAWDSAVDAAVPWRPEGKRTIVVAPHPDDEVLGCGGLISHQRRRNVPVVVVAVTDGEAAYPDQAVPGLAAIRRAEQTRALASLGVAAEDIVRLGIPDGDVEVHEEWLTQRLLDIVRPGDLVVAPWVHDHHCDHVACGRAAVSAADGGGAAGLGSLFWAYHFTDPAIDPCCLFMRMDLDRELVERREKALSAHASQLSAPIGHPVLDAQRLRPLDRRVELYVVSN